ncbi:MAG TPA: LysR family transcriptional regulator [Selenomonadales bacterium]|nr:LysR family transcriptional regulator [Selenomonadales bacterium]
MDFKKLQYFLTVAEEGKVTKAAERLHMAQPPLSHQLKVFERELGVQLLEKVGREVRLTKVGQALREKGEQILSLVDTTVKELKDLEAGQQGTLSIGSVPSWGTTLLPEKMLDFNRRYPSISFQLWEGTPQRITKLLHNGIIELAIVPSSYDTREYNSIGTPSEPVVAAIPRAWDKSPGVTTTTLAELADMPLIIYRNASKSHMECFYKHNLSPKIVCIHDDVRTMLALSEAGLGVTVAPQSATRTLPSQNLVYKELTGPAIPLSISAAVIWPKDQYISSAAQHFLQTFETEKN